MTFRPGRAVARERSVMCPRHRSGSTQSHLHPLFARSDAYRRPTASASGVRHLGDAITAAVIRRVKSIAGQCPAHPCVAPAATVGYAPPSPARETRLFGLLPSLVGPLATHRSSRSACRQSLQCPQPRARVSGVRGSPLRGLAGDEQTANHPTR